VELKPSAMQCEAHLCGQERNNYSYSKTISPPEALSYRLSSIGYSSAPRQALLSAISYQLSAIGYQLSAIGYRLFISAWVWADIRFVPSVTLRLVTCC